MSKSDTETATRTAPTVHGDIEYEVVECGSCNQKVAKEDAQRFVVGNLESRQTLQHIDKDKFEFDARTVTTGWACEFCHENEVAGFPEKTPSKGVRGYDFQTLIIVFTVAELVLIIALVLVATGAVL
jgi:hypothetical protein